MGTIYYLFDPLCGWCYGATPGVSVLNDLPDINVELLPTGLFSDESSLPMTREFSAYAWRNDLRINEITGQVFSKQYQTKVLGNFQQRFDSGPATLALTAVFATEPQKELAALKAIQHARYVDGKDVTNSDVLAELLTALELDTATAAFLQKGNALRQVNIERLAEARQFTSELNVRGVPNFIAAKTGNYKLLNARAIYQTPLALRDELAAMNVVKNPQFSL